ncbi:uncharacterized protein LOC129873317 [Solanum dulcamara]|uniref:uncharacterized protein LOC129873317 n=1 Tax=Solanum dulcamara TaxID=45834 RepID=UPI00248680DA|nr:uncharacterized protein LOC129873317 [Solanum dulcamara]
MVRTKATTALEPAVGVVAIGGVATISRSRGRGKKPTRSRGQAARPTRERAATPPPADKVAREDIEVEDEHVNEREAPPLPTPEMIHQGNAKIWWQSHVECRPAEAPPMTWATFSDCFMEKYIPRTLKDRRRDEFLNIEQWKMSVAAYESKFHALDRYATQLCFSPKERIRRFVKELRSDLWIPALQVASSAKSFQEVVDFVIEMDGVKPDNFSKETTFKKIRKGGEFSGSYSRGKSSGDYSTHPIHSSLQSSSSSQRPTLDPKTCYGSGESGHIKKYCPRKNQAWHDQGYRAPAVRGGGDDYGRGRYSRGYGGQGRGGRQPDMDGGKVGANGVQPGKGNGQTSDRAYCYAFPGRPEAEASDVVITGWPRLS